MLFQEFVDNLDAIQEIILNIINEEEENLEFEFENLKSEFENQRIGENKNDLKAILYLISKISNNYHQTQTFYIRIQRILSFLKDNTIKFFSNFEIFNIFKENKRLLLFLFNEKIIIPDKLIFSHISKNKFKKRGYIQYFYPEFKIFNSNSIFEMDTELFDKNRKKGVNDNYICELIQNDSIEDFVAYTNRTNFLLSSKVSSSIFETNLFLLKHEPTLIEYSAFYGSIQIFTYLFLNKVKLSPSIWLYAIHSKSSDLIHLIEPKVKPPKNNFCECYEESVKCYHIDIMNYIKNTLFQNGEEKLINELVLSLRYFNFSLMSNILGNFGNVEEIAKDDNAFYYLCKSDYCNIVDFLLKNSRINVNYKKVL
ncbi:hypothetical protein M9Y10_023648 [Tritrichomonas musculus]|uniref:DUF3447 domain-containing protein n=1 Tax=Tritrichomonas musculus TaxID=1915356 RepID=A0ABR2KWM7_9EUKA